MEFCWDLIFPNLRLIVFSGDEILIEMGLLGRLRLLLIGRSYAA